MEGAKISEVVPGDLTHNDTPELEKSSQINSSDLAEGNNSESEEGHQDASELAKRKDYPETKSDGEESLRDEEKEEETKIPLMQEDQVNIDIKLEGEDTPTLPMGKKAKEDVEHKKKPPMYLFPITRMKLAWTGSSNICDFVLKASLIIFSTIGWMFCVGGIPFISIAMLVIGSIYINDCNAQPNIPIYLIVSGVFGTIQHFIAIWTKYVPKESQGRLKVYRSYCRVIDGVLTLFVFIWFVLGCIWVYGVKEVEFRDTYKDEYCHKTLYYFSFWLLNFSFIVLSLVLVLSLCCILCIVSSPKDEEKGIVQ